MGALKQLFVIALMMILSKGILNAFPFDESNFFKYPYSKYRVDFDDIRITSNKFNMSEYSFDGIRCVLGGDPTTKSEIIVSFDGYDFESAKGDLRAIVTDVSGQRYISESYTVIITKNKNIFGAHLYFSNISTTLCIMRYDGDWYGSWVYFTNK